MTASETGWECPRCHRAFAPHVDECSACGKEDLWGKLRDDEVHDYQTGLRYRFSGLADGDKRTWSIQQVGAGKGIIDPDGRVLINTDLACYCHPCAQRRQ